jgi:WD40 repeat protein
VFASESGRPLINPYEGNTLWHSEAAAFTRDGRRLISARDGLVAWDTQQWKILERTNCDNRALVTLSLSSDGHSFVTAGDGMTLRVGTVRPLAETAVLGHHTARIKSVAFSPDGTEVASAGDDKSIALWDVDRRKLVARIGTHTSPVYAVAFSADGKRLASGEHDRSVRVYTRHPTIFGYRLD